MCQCAYRPCIELGCIRSIVSDHVVRHRVDVNAAVDGGRMWICNRFPYSILITYIHSDCLLGRKQDKSAYTCLS